MTNNTIVGVYYDTNGNINKIVHADNDDYTPHDEPGLTCVFIDKEEYNLLPATNIQGLAHHVGINKRVVEILSAQPGRTTADGGGPDLTSLIQVKVDDVETQIAEEEAVLAATLSIIDPDPAPPEKL